MHVTLAVGCLRMEVVAQNVDRGINTNYDGPGGQVYFCGRAADRRCGLSSEVKAGDHSAVMKRVTNEIISEYQPDPT